MVFSGAGGNHGSLLARLQSRGPCQRLNQKCISTVPAKAPAIFSRDAPLVLDLGCGNGVFLAALARLQPGNNFLGVERKPYRVRQATRRMGGLPNAVVVHGDAVDALKDLPPASVSRVYLLFSDPWPKRRHALRRLVQADFVSLLDARLEAGGVFFFASDSAEYGEWTKNVLQAAGWKVRPWEVFDDWPRTEFEQRFASAGVEITRLQATR